MSDMMKGAVIAGLIAIVIWFGFCIGFNTETTPSFIGAPIVFAVAFAIAVVISKITDARAGKAG